MVTRVDSVSTNDSILKDTKVKNQKNEEKKETIDFSSESRTSNDYDVNTKDNIFLKEYIEGKAAAEGVKIPAIKISTFNTSNQRDLYSGNALKGIAGIQSEKYWVDFLSGNDNSVEEFCDKKGYTAEQKEKIMELHRFHDVRVNIFKARIKDMFALLSKERDEVEKRVAKMNITDEQKTEIMQVKDFLDKYYKVEAELNGKTYNLLNLTKQEKNELQKSAPEFLEFIQKMQPELRKQTAYFAQKEMQSEELSDAGQSSRAIAWPLMVALVIGIGKGYFEGKEMREGIKNAEKFAEFIRNNPQEGNKILEKCVNKYNKLNKNGTLYTLKDTGEPLKGFSKIKEKIFSLITRTPMPANKMESELAGKELIERYMKKIGYEGGEYLVFQKALHSQGLKKWINPITKFKNAKGAAFWTLIAGTAALSLDDCMGAGKDFFQDQNNFGFGTGLGFAVAGVAGGIASSAAVVPTFQGIVDYTRADKTLRKMGILPKLKIANKLLHKGKAALFGIPLGIILASTSSGSSWTSMGLTRWIMGANGDELENKNIIDKKDNTFSATNENMMEYEAYKGKWEGITTGITGDWTIGTIGGAAGVFTHSNPVIQNSFTTLQGCSETLTASGYQILGNEIRNAELNREKAELVESAKKQTESPKTSHTETKQPKNTNKKQAKKPEAKAA